MEFRNALCSCLYTESLTLKATLQLHSFSQISYRETDLRISKSLHNS